MLEALTAPPLFSDLLLSNIAVDLPVNLRIFFVVAQVQTESIAPPLLALLLLKYTLEFYANVKVEFAW